ncbi:MAG: TetR/AcrR family transcriptional regulator [Thermocrispum sp.]
MSTQTEPRWRRLEPDERREQILERAIDLFGERPYAEVSTGDVARAAGVARGLINHYFESKRGLYLAAVKRIVTVPTFDPANLPDGPLRARVETSVDWLLTLVSKHAKGWIAVLGAEGIGSDPEVERILAESDRRAAENLIKSVGLHEAEPRGPELRALVRAYGGMVKAAVREWMIHATLTREQVLLLLTEQLTTLLDSTFPQLQRLGD